MINNMNDMHVTRTDAIAQDTIEMVLLNRYVSKRVVPGQFLYIRLENKTLRRPISIADVNKDSGTVTILFKILGSGTKQLASISEGEKIHALGPNGNGFPLEGKDDRHLLIVGGGIGVPPLYYLARLLAEQNIKITCVLGFQTKKHVFYEKQFKALADTHIVTDDGSYGHKGFVTNVMESINEVDFYYACGPLPMLEAVKAQCNDIPGYLSLEERMGCGIGACLACVVQTTDGGYKKICKDGPVFPAKEVQL